MLICDGPYPQKTGPCCARIGPKTAGFVWARGRLCLSAIPTSLDMCRYTTFQQRPSPGARPIEIHPTDSLRGRGRCHLAGHTCRRAQAKHSAPCRLCASAEQHSIRWQEKGSIRVGGTAECVFLAVAGRLVVRSLIGAGILLHTTTFLLLSPTTHCLLPGYKYLRLSASSQAKHSM